MRDKDREDSLHIQLVSGMEQTVESMREAGEIKKDRKREREKVTPNCCIQGRSEKKTPSEHHFSSALSDCTLFPSLIFVVGEGLKIVDFFSR